MEEQGSFELCLWASGDEPMFVPECKSRNICKERFYMIFVEIVMWEGLCLRGVCVCVQCMGMHTLGSERWTWGFFLYC